MSANADALPDLQTQDNFQHYINAKAKQVFNDTYPQTYGALSPIIIEKFCSELAPLHATNLERWKNGHIDHIDTLFQSKFTYFIDKHKSTLSSIKKINDASNTVNAERKKIPSVTTSNLIELKEKYLANIENEISTLKTFDDFNTQAPSLSQ